MPTIKQFVSDLQVPGCNVIVGDINTADDILTVDNLESHLKKFEGKNRYVVSGCDPSAGVVRVSDKDILQKNHIFFDFDLKSEHPSITLEEIKEVGANFITYLQDSPYANWRYIVFTGGGLHLHYFSKEPVTPSSNRAFAAGYKVMMREIEALVSEKADGKCSNIARLVRLPGSWNSKQLTFDRWGEAQPVEILHAQNVFFDFGPMEALGAAELEKQAEKAKQKAAELKDKFSTTEASTYNAINEIPISGLVCLLKGWETDGRNFWSPGTKKYKACFVPEGENFLVHGGTDHLGSADGYNCFTFVQYVEGHNSNKETFEWFKKNYPAINDVSEREFQEILEKQHEERIHEEIVSVVPSGNVAAVFERLQNFNFEFLQTGLQYADTNKWLIRGAVTRIGAASSVGKSAFAYWLSHHLLQKGHKGVIISSEVQAPLVLANLLRTKNKWDFWEILHHEQVPSAEDLDFYKNLWVFDSLATKNSMETIKPLLHEIKPDFVVIDFLQGIKPSDEGSSGYEKLTNYAFEVQQMAQELEASVIDLSQISNSDIKDSNKKTDPTERLNLVNFKGSGDLYSSADVCLMLDRNKTADIDAEYGPDHFGVRMAKHKYMETGYVFLKSDFATGRFTLADSKEVDPETGWPMTLTAY